MTVVSFFVALAPGTYFLNAEYAGYVSSVAKFAPEDLTGDGPADFEKVEKALIKVIVAANKDSVRDIELQRGAAISGTVRYDDGSPANEVQISVLRIGADGKASEFSLHISGQMRSAMRVHGEDIEANDVGHYRVSGLPAGKYIVKTTFPMQASSVAVRFGGAMAGRFQLDIADALSVYSGNVFREKDAKPVEVTAGSDRDDVDITISLLGLHTVSGSVTALADGHAIGTGFVKLLYSDDKSEARATS